MAQQSQIGKHATTISQTDGRTVVTYHTTPVVTVDADGTVTLNSGGWRSATTKTRINQAASQLDLRFHVYQRDFQWFVSGELFGTLEWGEMGELFDTLEFEDGIQFRVERDARRTA